MKPALTPKEWGQLKYEEAFLDDGNLNVIFDSGCAAELIFDTHALAALCLHGQPFGFGREDVDALRFTADELERYGKSCKGTVCDDDKAEPLFVRAASHRSLADRIEALLPPNE